MKSQTKNDGIHGSFWDVGVEPKNRGKTPKWMVKIMEIPIELDDLGYHHLRKHPYLP